MWVSGVQQRDSVINIHVSILFKIFFPFSLLQNTEQSSLCYTVGSCWLSILNIALYIHAVLRFPSGLAGKESTCNAGDTGDSGLFPGLGRFPWRQKWQATSVFLPGESHGQRSLAATVPWGHKESDTTEGLLMHADTHALIPNSQCIPSFN